ncbi:CCA tRNA nucleotidyltransferase [Parenemella sanctibonifatiensis]|uniref:CCA tRNA nucleotidyltransferase n=1 Tax=Parenemella sanctibonifatiensis TaxID=2016505 RepID=A0A255EFT3_9ACTN|nr:CCA tRNA nucleotidyltransferase [Parenemella sanctibonifatiensis]OYN90376.1 CCA tRNA nucleotidyltransferase [Parenemella sanctibonifatiensis]
MASLLQRAPVVSELGATFAAAGHELHLVGGSVRDALLGKLGTDLDFTTDARPDTIEALLRRHTHAIWDMGRAFGTIGARLPRDAGATAANSATSDDTEASEDDWVVEITTFRADAYAEDSRKPDVAFGDTLQGDLVRRDFTVNAMALQVGGPDLDPAGPAVLTDPFDGLGDLSRGLIRTPATAEQSFTDDPLRMLRAARFTAQLSTAELPFEPDEDVVAAMTAMADRIEIVSAERIRDELDKLICTPAPRPGLNLLVATGLAARVLPELPNLQLERDEHHRHKDVYQHSLTVLDQAIELESRLDHSPDRISRWAALLHDIGKPATRRFEPGGKVSFHHHDVVGAKLARKRLQALRFSKDDTAAICRLIELHLRFHGYGEGQWTDAAVRRYVRDAGDQLERLHILTRADCTTRNQRKATRLRRAYDELEHRIDHLAEQEELAAIRPDLNGDQIMQILDLKPGPEVGQAYAFLLELRMERGPLDEAAATEALLAWWRDRS